ncbi:hypothetical protein LTR87_016076 [Friedmanniomyces endolithicus]|uniref:Uncharacterized protein n=1 Tax=Friedmanniomyces endolithicus TaxID=329885 RepID=A0A4V5N5B5_9PEZI|nr:hypothetical protein LTS09_017712 [Friedmanniomyces endolithicus]KAK0863739.1 hypothetical protein LTR87_016076 [Friedmanniomyces endolithicus]TKA24809.1 hypothetical protein B0A54_17731 [Friedmanniomyces endolithicus]
MALTMLEDISWPPQHLLSANVVAFRVVIGQKDPDSDPDLEARATIFLVVRIGFAVEVGIQENAAGASQLIVAGRSYTRPSHCGIVWDANGRSEDVEEVRELDQHERYRERRHKLEHDTSTAAGPFSNTSNFFAVWETTDPKTDKANAFGCKLNSTLVEGQYTHSQYSRCVVEAAWAWNIETWPLDPMNIFQKHFAFGYDQLAVRGNQCVQTCATPGSFTKYSPNAWVPQIRVGSVLVEELQRTWKAISEDPALATDLSVSVLPASMAEFSENLCFLGQTLGYRLAGDWRGWELHHYVLDKVIGADSRSMSLFGTDRLRRFQVLWDKFEKIMPTKQYRPREDSLVSSYPDILGSRLAASVTEATDQWRFIQSLAFFDLVTGL